jgi:hypothetical protein
MKTFKKWLILKEGKDIFGFEKERAAPKKVVDESPIIPINPDVLIDTMLETNLGGRKAFSDFPDQIQWGREPGAIQMVISPLGSFKSIVRKLHTNLKGESVWICKKIIPYTDILHASKQFDEAFASELFEQIEKVSKGDLEAPLNNYIKLDSLTIKIANYCRRKDIIPEIFMFRGIKQIKKNENYLIFFEPRGQGVETPGSARLEQFIIDMSYNPETGMVKSFGHDVQSPIKGHVWYPQPSEWEEYFSPSQSPNEITEAIGAALSTY